MTCYLACVSFENGVGTIARCRIFPPVEKPNTSTLGLRPPADLTLSPADLVTRLPSGARTAAQPISLAKYAFGFLDVFNLFARKGRVRLWSVPVAFLVAPLFLQVVRS